MTVSMPDRLFVQEVLGGKHRAVEQETRTPVISEMENSDPPVLASSGAPCLAAAAMIVLFSTGWFALNFLCGIHLPFAGLLLLIIAVIAVSFPMSVSRENRKKQWDELLEEARIELSTLLDEHKDFLVRLDERMVKYFNSNTINDSYILFVLMQIRDHVDHRLKKITDLLEEPDYEELLLAHHLFVKPLAIRESVIAGLGRSHPLPISKVRETSVPLIEYVQEGLHALEAEAAERQEEFKRKTDGWKAA